MCENASTCLRVDAGARHLIGEHHVAHDVADRVDVPVRARVPAGVAHGVALHRRAVEHERAEDLLALHAQHRAVLLDGDSATASTVRTYGARESG